MLSLCAETLEEDGALHQGPPGFGPCSSSEGSSHRLRPVVTLRCDRDLGSYCICPGSVLPLGFMVHIQGYKQLYTHNFNLIKVHVMSTLPSGVDVAYLG